jgi:NAD(P)-dependent dehydrogenase (short-subunit alcohol dehydrogenase family)
MENQRDFARKIVPNKVLVTGASGLLGVAAIEKFLSAGRAVAGASRCKPELCSPFRELILW